MKNLLLVLVTALVTSIATAVAVEFLRGERAPARTSEPVAAPTPPAAASAPGPAPRAAEEALVAPPPLDDPDLAARLERLEQRLAEVEAARTAAATRVPLAQASRTDAPGAWPAGSDPRTFVLGVLEDERARRQQEETELWEARSVERLGRTAAWLGEELGLAPREQEALLGILREESFRRNEIFRTLRESESDLARAGARAEFEELRRWKETELVAQFGPTIAKSLMDLERDRSGPMRAFGGFPGDDARAPRRERETPWPR